MGKKGKNENRIYYSDIVIDVNCIPFQERIIEMKLISLTLLAL